MVMFTIIVVIGFIILFKFKDKFDEWTEPTYTYKCHKCKEVVYHGKGKPTSYEVNKIRGLYYCDECHAEEQPSSYLVGAKQSKDCEAYNKHYQNLIKKQKEDGIYREPIPYRELWCVKMAQDVKDGTYLQKLEQGVYESEEYQPKHYR